VPPAPDERDGVTTTVVNLNRANGRYTRYIGRPSEWGNPFVIGRDGTRDEVCDKYEALVRARPDMMARIKAELKGQVLGCYCKPQRCHGDTLAKIAEEP
jgi:hypothetical protein